jgi:hypothetical protein
LPAALRPSDRRPVTAPTTADPIAVNNAATGLVTECGGRLPYLSELCPQPEIRETIGDANHFGRHRQW